MVVDTNVLLTHLEMVRQYVETSIEDVGQAVFICPWEVLQLLDILHEHVNSAILERVKKAVEFLQNALVSKFPRIVFETFEEVCTLLAPSMHAFPACC